MVKFYLYLRRVLMLLLVSGSLTTLAQEIVIKGKVTSADDNAPLPGVNVLEKGTTNGAVTDSDGNYSVSVKSNATLVFSFIGYATQEITVAAQTNINVSLQVDAIS